MAKYKVLLNPSDYLGADKLEVDVIEPRLAPSGSYSLKGSGTPIDEAELGRALDEIVLSWQGKKTESDVQAAVMVHQTLHITRRDASDRDMWTFLNVTCGWPYVCWRWGSSTVSKGRVAGGLDRSALARLWWMAELCGDGAHKDRQERLEILLRNQDRAVALYERPRMFRRPGMAAELLKVTRALCSSWDEDGYREFARSCRSYFGVRLTYSMSGAEVEKAVRARAELTIKD